MDTQWKVEIHGLTDLAESRNAPEAGASKIGKCAGPIVDI